MGAQDLVSACTEVADLQKAHVIEENALIFHVVHAQEVSIFLVIMVDADALLKVVSHIEHINW